MRVLRFQWIIGVKEPQAQFIFAVADSAPLSEQLIGLLLMMEPTALYIVIHGHTVPRG